MGIDSPEESGAHDLCEAALELGRSFAEMDLQNRRQNIERTVIPLVQEVQNSEMARAVVVRFLILALASSDPATVIKIFPQLESHLPGGPYACFFRPAKLAASVLSDIPLSELPSDEIGLMNFLDKRLIEETREMARAVAIFIFQMQSLTSPPG